MDNLIIIPILLCSNKTKLSSTTGNLVSWLIYFIISNLNYKKIKQCKKPSKLLLDLILIHKENNIDVKLDIYYICLRIITKQEENLSNLLINARKTLCYLLKADKIVLKLEVAKIEKLKMTYANIDISICHSIITRFISNSKKQVIVTSIKLNMHCIICTILSNKHNNLYKDWPLQIHKKLQAQVKYQKLFLLAKKSSESYLDDIYPV